MPIYAYSLQFMLMFWSYTPYFCTTLVYKTGKFIWKCLCNTCSLIFIPARGRGAIRTGGPGTNKHYFMPIYAYILQFMMIFWFLLYIFAQLLFTKPVNLSENVSVTLVHSFLSQLGAWTLLDQVSLYQKVLDPEQFCMKFIVPSKPNWFRWGRPPSNRIAKVFFSKPGADPIKRTGPDH